MVQTENRLHALDAVRSAALLLGIVLHGAMSFMPGLGASGWPIVDRSPSEFLQGTFFVIHIFRMTMFFAIAGFFAHLLFHSRGLAGFAKDRSRRVLVPFVAAWVVLVPIVGAILYWAAMSRSNGAPPQAPPSGIPLMHLWFLYLLAIFYVIVPTLRHGLTRFLGSRALDRIDHVVAWFVRQPIGPFFLALPVALSLHFQDGWIPFAGIPTPDMSLLPNLPAFVGYGVAFSFGWLLHRQISALAHLSRVWWAHLGVAIVMTGISMVLLDDVMIRPDSAITRIAYIAAYTGASWSWTFAIIGAAMHFLGSNRPTIRYLADSSYWIYLVHLPIVFALQQAMSGWAMHWSLKFPLLLAITMLVLLASYHWFVRSTFIGQALNGRRYPRSSNGSAIGAVAIAAASASVQARLSE
jgi:peptidoglycan/LPS O-acetylase OafA/YrhL